MPSRLAVANQQLTAYLPLCFSPQPRGYRREYTTAHHGTTAPRRLQRSLQRASSWLAVGQQAQVLLGGKEKLLPVSLYGTALKGSMNSLRNQSRTLIKSKACVAADQQLTDNSTHSFSPQPRGYRRESTPQHITAPRHHGGCRDGCKIKLSACCWPTGTGPASSAMSTTHTHTHKHVAKHEHHHHHHHQQVATTAIKREEEGVATHLWQPYCAPHR